MIFFVAYADLPSPPPPAPYVAPAPLPAPPAPPPTPPAPGGRDLCPLGTFKTDGTACPHPAYWGLAQGSDVPGRTLGSTDAAYGKALTDELCEVKPWTC